MKLSTKLTALLQTLPEENTTLLSLRIFICVILSYFHYVRPSVAGGINGLTMLTIYFGGREHTKQRGPTKHRKTVVFNLWIWVWLTFLRVLTFSARSRSKIRSWGWEKLCRRLQGRMEIIFFLRSRRVFEDKGKFRRRSEWFRAWPLGQQCPMQPNIQSTGGTKIVNTGTNVRQI